MGAGAGCQVRAVHRLRDQSVVGQYLPHSHSPHHDVLFRFGPQLLLDAIDGIADGQMAGCLWPRQSAHTTVPAQTASGSLGLASSDAPAARSTYPSHNPKTPESSFPRSAPTNRGPENYQLRPITAVYNKAIARPQTVDGPARDGWSSRNGSSQPADSQRESAGLSGFVGGGRLWYRFQRENRPLSWSICQGNLDS